MGYGIMLLRCVLKQHNHPSLALNSTDARGERLDILGPSLFSMLLVVGYDCSFYSSSVFFVTSGKLFFGHSWMYAPVEHALNTFLL